MYGREQRYGSGQEAGVYYIDNFTVTAHGDVPDADYSSMEFKGSDDKNSSSADDKVIETTPVTFSDVEKHWAKDTVNTLATYGYIEGIGDNLYSPDTNVTRAQFIKMMADSFQVQDPKYVEIPYTDVKGNEWFAPAVKVARSLNLLEPVLTFGNRFLPNQAITREEAALVAARVAAAKKAAKKTENVSFKDDSAVSEWVKAEVKDAAEYGLIEGYEDGEFKPLANITRAEAAEILKRIAEIETRFNIYVDSETGNDQNEGTQKAPFKTVYKAVETVRKYNKNMHNDIQVRIKGEHYLNRTLALTEEDSGMNGYKVIYTSWGEEKPVLSMGTKHTGFELYDAKKNIYRVYVGEGRQTRQAYFNGVRGIRSRSVAGLANPKIDVDAGHYISDDTQLLNYAHPERIEMILKANWCHSKLAMNDVKDNGDGTVTITPVNEIWKPATYRFKGFSDHRRFPTHLENAYEFVDEPGEWYLESDDGMMYYIPREGDDMSTMEVTVPKGEQLLTITGADYEKRAKRIVFDNIEFSYTDNARPFRTGGWSGSQNGIYEESSVEVPPHAVTVKNARNVEFTNNKFSHMVSGALLTHDSIQFCNIVGNEFVDLGGNAINLGLYSDARDTHTPEALNTNNRVENNYIHHIAVEHQSSVGIAACWPRHTTISHNEIVDTPYSGMHIGWGWGLYVASGTPMHDLEISSNYIHEVLNDRFFDGAGIYTLGTASLENPELRNRLTRNYFENMRNGYGSIYPDEGSSDWNITENVVDMKDVPNWRFHWGDLGIYENKDFPWLFIWTDTIRRITAEHNYSTNDVYRNDGQRSTISVQDNYHYPNANWPDEAKQIIAEAGIEEAYLDNFAGITGPQVLTSDETQYTLTKGTSLDIGLKVLGHYKKEYPRENFNIDYWVADPAILEVSENGMMKGKSVGSTFVVANAVIDGVPQVRTIKVDVDSDFETLGTKQSSYSMLAGFEQQITVNAKTALGQTKEVPTENVTYEIADESIASINEDGVLSAKKQGQTTLKVTAEYMGLTMNEEISVNVITYSKEDSLELPYKLAPDSLVHGNWTGESSLEENAIAVTGSPAFNLDFQLGSELYAFDMEIRNPNGWPTLTLRSSERMGSYADSDCYMIGFKKDIIELQRFNKGERTMIFGEDEFLPIGGPGIPNSPEMPLYEYGKKMSVITGVIDTAQGPRIVLTINGRNIFDYVDTDPKAVKKDGYFGVYNSGDFVFSPYTGITD